MIVFSCEPSRAENGDILNGVDGTGGNGGTDNPTTVDRLLMKMISHEKNEDTGEWEDATLSFQYEGSKLISYDDGSGGKTNFTYNANNKISKVSNPGLTSTLEYSNGNVSKLTTILTGVGNIVSNYTYTSGKLSKVVSVQEYTIPIPMKIYLEASYQYSGENIVKEIIKTGFYLPDGTLQMDPNQDQSFDFTYDDKKSPFKLLPKEFCLWLAGVGPHGAAFTSTNNIKTQTVTVNGTSEPIITYSHEYDPENYLIKSTGDDGETLQYEYKK